MVSVKIMWLAGWIKHDQEMYGKLNGVTKTMIDSSKNSQLGVQIRASNLKLRWKNGWIKQYVLAIQRCSKCTNAFWAKNGI